MGIQNKLKITTACVIAMCAPLTALAAEGRGGDGDYAAHGVPLGGFTLYPTLELSFGFDDNILAQQTNQIDDTLYTLKPELNLVSNWSRHELVLSVTNKTVWHSEQSSEDLSDWSFGAEGRLDVSYATSIHARAIYSMLTERRGDTNAVGNAAEPTEYDRFDAYAELRHQFNQLGVALGGGITTFDYSDVAATGGGTIDNDNRDRTVLLGRAEVNYGISPDTKVFVRGTMNEREYDQQPPVALVNRDSQGYEVVSGLSFDVTHLIEGEIFAGYLEQNYDALTDINGLSYGAALDWYPTQLSTISASLTRSVEETNSIGASGYLRTAANVSFRHELLRNVSVTMNGAFSTNDYEGIAREEDIWSAGLEAEYLVNRNLAATVGYSYETRDSSLAGADYDRNRAYIGLIGRF